MPDPVDVLVLDLLEWIGPDGKPYRAVMEAWRTSCPRLPVWEEANERGFIERHCQGSEAMIRVSALGVKALAERIGPTKNIEQEKAEVAEEGAAYP